MDRLYTSISTSNWLLAQNITSVGTLLPIVLDCQMKSSMQKIVMNLKAACIGSKKKVILLCVSIPPTQNLYHQLDL